MEEGAEREAEEKQSKRKSVRHGTEVPSQVGANWATSKPTPSLREKPHRHTAKPPNRPPFGGRGLQRLSADPSLRAERRGAPDFQPVLEEIPEAELFFAEAGCGFGSRVSGASWGLGWGGKGGGGWGARLSEPKVHIAQVCVNTKLEARKS